MYDDGRRGSRQIAAVDDTALIVKLAERVRGHGGTVPLALWLEAAGAGAAQAARELATRLPG